MNIHISNVGFYAAKLWLEAELLLFRRENKKKSYQLVKKKVQWRIPKNRKVKFANTTNTNAWTEWKYLPRETEAGTTMSTVGLPKTAAAEWRAADNCLPVCLALHTRRSKQAKCAATLLHLTLNKRRKHTSKVYNAIHRTVTRVPSPFSAHAWFSQPQDDYNTLTISRVVLSRSSPR